jgi:hypothetical protein
MTARADSNRACDSGNGDEGPVTADVGSTTLTWSAGG